MQPSATQPIRPDIDAILHQAFPRGAMGPAFDIQESHLAKVFPRLKTRLLQLNSSAIRFERDPLGGSGWKAGTGHLPSDPAQSGGRSEDRPASYYLFFLATTAPACRVGDGKTLQLGFTVALSIMAPLALIVLNYFEEDDLAYSVPEISAEAIEDENGDLMEIGAFCRQVLSAQGQAELERLRGELTALLAEFGYQILPEEEQGKPVTWLKVPPMPFAPQVAHLTVRDALFFWAI